MFTNSVKNFVFEAYFLYFERKKLILAYYKKFSAYIKVTKNLWRRPGFSRCVKKICTPSFCLFLYDNYKTKKFAACSKNLPAFMKNTTKTLAYEISFPMGLQGLRTLNLHLAEQTTSQCIVILRNRFFKSVGLIN